MVWQEKLVQPTLDSQASMDASAALQNSYALEGTVTLQDLPAMLSEVTSVPVWLDKRAIEFAKLDASGKSTEFSQTTEMDVLSVTVLLNATMISSPKTNSSERQDKREFFT